MEIIIIIIMSGAAAGVATQTLSKESSWVDDWWNDCLNDMVGLYYLLGIIGIVYVPYQIITWLSGFLGIHWGWVIALLILTAVLAYMAWGWCEDWLDRYRYGDY